MSKYLKNITSFLVVLFFILGLVFFITFIIGYYYEYEDKYKLSFNSFVDLTNAINGIVTPIWTIVSSLLFFLALIIQRKEFQLQREEFEQQRKEFSRTADAQEKTERSISRQIELLKKVSIIDKHSTYAKIYSDLAKIETDPKIIKKYKIICLNNCEKIDELTKKIDS